MNPRHAAALALVGWYLMVPPQTPGGGPHTVLFHAPLSKWKVGEGNETKAACEKSRRESIADEKHITDVCEVGSCAVTVVQYAHGHCMADDDPRLKDNADVAKSKRSERN
jgi:hypothetical protein